jgi:CRISPR-associated endoribonuclease Cas2
MAKQTQSDNYISFLRKLKTAGISNSPPPNLEYENDYFSPLNERIQKLLGIVNNSNKNKNNMLFFVMYDIENDKVRRYIVKYLLAKGCHRVQKSIFLAEANAETYEAIKNDLSMVQQVYENNDSILIVPISTDLLHAMKIIGQNIDIDLITNNKNTLFY